MMRTHGLLRARPAAGRAGISVHVRWKQTATDNDERSVANHMAAKPGLTLAALRPSGWPYADWDRIHGVSTAATAEILTDDMRRATDCIAQRFPQPPNGQAPGSPACRSSVWSGK
jgi:hypothetical protein